LNNQQGMVVNDELGIIVINENDIRTRQRFTEAHELMELLFSALPKVPGLIAQANRFKHRDKERVCNIGAAELLMPKKAFLSRLNEISFQSAGELSLYFDVSREAILVRMTEIGFGRHAVVLWKIKNKPTEIEEDVSPYQGSLFENFAPSLPQKKLRVEWAFCGPNVNYVPLHKSVPEDSSIFQAWKSGKFTASSERLYLGGEIGLFYCENQPFKTNSEMMVLSLLHCPGDRCCTL